MTRSSTRLWVAGTVVVALVVVAASWFGLVAPKRAEAAGLQQQTVDTDAQNADLQTRIAELEAQFEDLPERRAELAEVRRSMPVTPDLPTLVRDLDDMADRTGVTLMNVAPGQPLAVVDPSATPEAVTPEAGTDAAAADGTVTPAVPAGPQLYQLPTTVVVVGEFFKAELFLRELQAEMKRALLVETLSIQAEQSAAASGGKPATDNGDITMTLTGSVFVLSDPAADSSLDATVDGAGTGVAADPAAPPATEQTPDGSTTS